jgi:ribosomal protein S18 acetylase RimI-like enzyme
MATVLRRLTPDDAPIARQVVALFHGRDIPIEYHERYLANPANYLYIADVDNALAGFLSAHRLDRLNRVETQFFIYEIEVAEEFRRRGIGSALMQCVLKMSMEERLEAFVFTNHSNQAAVQFYRGLGGVIENGDELMFEFRPWEIPKVPIP